MENLPSNHKTNYSLWKGNQTIKPPVESEKPLRKPCGAWATSADEKAILFANHLSDVFKPNRRKSKFSSLVIQKFLEIRVEVDLDEFKQIVCNENIFRLHDVEHKVMLYTPDELAAPHKHWQHQLRSIILGNTSNNYETWHHRQHPFSLFDLTSVATGSS